MNGLVVLSGITMAVFFSHIAQVRLAATWLVAWGAEIGRTEPLPTVTAPHRFPEIMRAVWSVATTARCLAAIASARCLETSWLGGWPVTALARFKVALAFRRLVDQQAQAL